MIKGARDRLRHWMEQKRRIAGEPLSQLLEARRFPKVCAFEQLYEEMHLFYSPLVTAPDFDNKLKLAQGLQAGVAILHAGSNDLAKKRRSPEGLAALVIEKVQKLLTDYGVKEVKSHYVVCTTRETPKRHA